MQELEVRPGRVTLKWAWKMALIMILITIALFYTKVDAKSFLNYVVYIPFIFGLMMAIKEHKEKDLEGFISFRRAFTTGFRYASIISFIMGVFMYIYLRFINPQVFEQSLVEAENIMLDQGKSDDQIEMALSMARSWGVFMAAISASIGYTLFGGFLSLIGAAIFKNARPIYVEVERDEL
ncbi:hypothetical protein Pedsa_0609 [Pseudopedobacter saltans DSM 12145]|uniref:DUF4199 domain-containing protein n=1 Tax=Pseudopedobacter saltans (strain ATCC 51119 / DSM 12145 / JCM 21818 / CCUG 39354 / LMG 10337 / NBRC 100064 / NCIMB 13643) TaxID=762903 RepID=F0S7G1_PSESL|nr:DUF4199 domain-containing protein [Pseudopedobacter saltans]ADY51186.1 hypothetical protein Pedsa_0609 [Pseudopedobacter saltans DSM 12145]